MGQLRARAALALLWTLAPCAALAQERASAVDRARALAEKAGDLLDDKRYAEALDQVTKAEALYHATTHLLMMAEAQEGLGRLAAAAETYERMVAEPLPPSAPAAFRNAQEQAKKQMRALLARVPSLLVVVRGAPSDDVHATVDGRPLSLAAGVATRLDPGSHKVRVTAEGYVPFERSVTLAEKGGVVVLEAPLELSGAPGGRGEGSGVAKPGSTAHDQGPAEDQARPRSRVPIYVAFGVGAAGLAVGAVSGYLSLRKVSDLDERCPDRRCTPSDQGDIDSAKTLGTVSTIGFAVGAAGIATGAVLLLTGQSPSRRAEHATTGFRNQLSPWLGPGAAGVRGRF